jgi:hypothetical protein
MIRNILLISGLLLTLSATAQSPKSFRNSIRLGANLTTVDMPDGRGTHLVARFARHLAKDRIVIALEGGILSGRSSNLPFNGFEIEPNRHHRLTSDLTAFLDLLPSKTHALRLGFGLSAWYRNDDVYRGATVLGGLNNPLNVAIDRSQRSGINTGTHLAAEYEWLLDPHVGLDVRFRFSDLRKAGISSTVGAGLNFRF